MELANQYHSLLNIAVGLVNENKNSISSFEKELLYYQLQKIEFKLQIAEFAFLQEEKCREFT